MCPRDQTLRSFSIHSHPAALGSSQVLLSLWNEKACQPHHLPVIHTDRHIQTNTYRKTYDTATLINNKVTQVSQETHSHTQTYIYTHRHTKTYSYTHTRIRTNIHTNTDTPTDIHTHTDTHLTGY